jgi:hypothetical protein
MGLFTGLKSKNLVFQPQPQHFALDMSFDLSLFFNRSYFIEKKFVVGFKMASHVQDGGFKEAQFLKS